MHPEYVGTSGHGWTIPAYDSTDASQTREALLQVADDLGWECGGGSLEHIVERFALSRGWRLDVRAGTSEILNGRAPFDADEVRVFQAFVFDAARALGRTEVEAEFWAAGHRVACRTVTPDSCQRPMSPAPPDPWERAWAWLARCVREFRVSCSV